MPPSKFDLYPYKDRIASLLLLGSSVAFISRFMKFEYGISVSARVLGARLEDWGLRQTQLPALQNEDLHIRVEELIFDYGLKDWKVIEVLWGDGFTISEHTLQRVRAHLGIRRRVNDPWEREQQRQEVEALITREIRAGNLDLGNYDVAPVHEYLRQRGYLFPLQRVADVLRYYWKEIDICPPPEITNLVSGVTQNARVVSIKEEPGLVTKATAVPIVSSVRVKDEPGVKTEIIPNLKSEPNTQAGATPLTITGHSDQDEVIVKTEPTSKADVDSPRVKSEPNVILPTVVPEVKSKVKEEVDTGVKRKRSACFDAQGSHKASRTTSISLRSKVKSWLNCIE
ncbi:hypothetical protein N7540_009263 [Penicillium herquei]|nr:hypothetical protein N7540_009263 [Penicillium herquei]